MTAASLGRLLKSRGLRVTIQKLDPYINVDPGTMNPYEHGEVFVTDDGAETDLDLGHYERFIDENLSQASATTTGSIYQSVIAKERKGDYLGKTVQVIPHVTDAIKARIAGIAAPDIDVVISEIGGTVGDIEILPFLEAIRQYRRDVGRDNVCYIHLTLIPYLGTSGEQKTKPTQHSVAELRSRGIQPDVLVCRSKDPIPQSMKAKLSAFCDVPVDGIVNAIDAPSIYEIPLNLHAEGLDQYVCDLLHLDAGEADLADWQELVKTVHSTRTGRKQVRIGIVGKYIDLQDAYLSVAEAVRHGGFANKYKAEVVWLAADDGDLEDKLAGLDGLIIPGGFGNRGIEGKIRAARWAREHGLPCLGICLGLQTMVIEFARDVLGLADANSTEFDPDTEHAVIALLNEQRDVINLGGTMRLGAQVALLADGSQVAGLYGREVATERHRHRYEVNPRFHAVLKDHGLAITGTSPDRRLVEYIELPGHPFWVATQAHPEFKSRPDRAHPLFRGLVAAAISYRRAQRPAVPLSAPKAA
jgi:CTP synthase